MATTSSSLIDEGTKKTPSLHDGASVLGTSEASVCGLKSRRRGGREDPWLAPRLSPGVRTSRWQYIAAHYTSQSHAPSRMRATAIALEAPSCRQRHIANCVRITPLIKPARLGSGSGAEVVRFVRISADWRRFEGCCSYATCLLPPESDNEKIDESHTSCESIFR